MIRRIAAFLLALGVVGAPLVARSAATNVYTFTATGASPGISCAGSSAAAVVLSGTGTGLTIVPQTSSDGGTTWNTATSVTGSLTANGTSSGPIGNASPTNFRINVTAISGGTETATYNCSTSVPTSTSGGSSAVTVTNPGSSPVPVAIVSPLGQAVKAASVPVTLASDQGALSVNTPVPCTAATCTSTAAGSTGVALAQDASNRAIIAGPGTAGTPSGGVVSVQGVAGGTALPISGTVTATTTFPYSAAPQAASANSFLGVACQNAGSNSATATQTLAIACDSTGRLLLGAGGQAIGSITNTSFAATVSNGGTLASDTSNRPIVVGAGTAGTPAGGVISVQGVAGGTAQPISGSVTAVLPFNSTSDAQATAANTNVGLQAYNGSTMDRLSVPLVWNAAFTKKSLAVSICDPGNGVALCQSIFGANADSQSQAGSFSQAASVGAQLFGYNGTTSDRVRKETYTNGPIWVTNGGGTTSTIAAGVAGPTVIKATAGRLETVVITTAGTATAVTFFDNASACTGTILGIIPTTAVLAGAVAGSAPYKFDMPAANGITACGGTTSAAVTVSFW